MMVRKSGLAQGEIFGVAMFFVILVIGIIVFSQFKALNPERETTNMHEERLNKISESALSTILDVSTGCEVERDKDSLRDLIQFCVDYTFVNYGEDPIFVCDGEERAACEYSRNILENSLKSFFNNGDFGVYGNSVDGGEILGRMPYLLVVSSEADSTIYGQGGFNLSNLIVDASYGGYEYKSFSSGSQSPVYVTLDNYLSKGFKRAPPGVFTVPTSQRAIRFELYLFYR